jgi:hypothetical protein
MQNLLSSKFDVRHLCCVITKLTSNWETVINTTLVVFMTVSQLLVNFVFQFAIQKFKDQDI